MGVDIHVRVCKYNPETNFFEELSLYRPRKEDEKYKYTYNEEKQDWVKEEISDPYIKISPYDERNYEMFEGMKEGGEDNGYGFFPITSISLPSLEPGLRKEIKECIETSGYYDFFEITLADINSYLASHPTVVDYESEDWENRRRGDPKPQKHNPIHGFFQRCYNYIELAERYGIDSDTPLSRYKVLFWFDR